MALYMSDSLARVEGYLIGVQFGDCIKPHPVCSRRAHVCIYNRLQTCSSISSAGLLVLTGIRPCGIRSQGVRCSWLTKVPLAFSPNLSNLIQSWSGGLAGEQVVEVSGNELERQ